MFAGKTLRECAFVVGLACVLAAGQVMASAAALPHLRKQGTTTQLIVEGKPYLALAAELHNSSASSLEYMEPLWPRLAATNINTVLATVSWELIEPEEGRFDFRLVDGLIEAARAHDLRLVFLWFASWKNGKSTYQPLWVKTDQQRFGLIKDEEGKSLPTLTTLSEANRDADARVCRLDAAHPPG
ncbi:MAG: beta-galactosidase [Sedimentisphaerales bacterium]|nr:beta-galactosidase [Sedimentisphaerales bacterium]